MTSWSLVQKNPTKCIASLCVWYSNAVKIEVLRSLGAFAPNTGGCCAKYWGLLCQILGAFAPNTGGCCAKYWELLSQILGAVVPLLGAVASNTGGYCAKYWGLLRQILGAVAPNKKIYSVFNFLLASSSRPSAYFKMRIIYPFYFEVSKSVHSYLLKDNW